MHRNQDLDPNKSLGTKEGKTLGQSLRELVAKPSLLTHREAEAWGRTGLFHHLCDGLCGAPLHSHPKEALVGEAESSSNKTPCSSVVCQFCGSTSPGNLDNCCMWSLLFLTPKMGLTHQLTGLAMRVSQKVC